MPTNYPGGVDQFHEPSQPEQTALSQIGGQASPGRNHVEHHRDLGDAVQALQEYASTRSHDHSGDSADRNKGAKLNAANTHQNVDTTSSAAIHHTLGVGPTNAAAGNHTHDYDGGSILNAPYIRCTAATRPASPSAGLTIYETDTNRMRAWGNFGGGNRWTILSTATIPIVRLAQSANQTISAGGTIVQWNEEIEDNFAYFTPATPTAITVTEPGLYQLDVGIQWGVNFIPEVATVAVCVNGQETTLRNSSLQLRSGLLSLLGVGIGSNFSQTMAVSGKLRLALGDVVSVKCSYGGSSLAGTIINTYFDLPSRVKSRLEMNYVGP